MLYREINAVRSEIHTEHKNTVCGQNVGFVNVKPSGTYSDHSLWRVLYKELNLFSPVPGSKHTPSQL